MSKQGSPMNIPPLLLIVDDNQENLSLLVDVLSPVYRVKVANSGKRALSLAVAEIPDLILLDIVMPEMDGFEVCHTLKNMAELNQVPVIFISAADDIDNKVKAFAVGGVDYVNKPFQVKELEARISTHLTLHKLQEELQEHKRHLDHQVHVKSSQLTEACERLTIVNDTKNEFLELIAHEIRTPANGIIGLTELIMDSYPSNTGMDELRAIFNRSRDRMIETLDNALLLAQLHVTKDDFHCENVVLTEVFSRIESSIHSFAQGDGVLVKFPSMISSSVLGDEILFQNAFEILCKTVIKFTSTGKSATIFAEEDSEHVIIRFTGEGLALDPAAVPFFFNVFSSVRSMTYAEELGLNPALAERIFALYGGKLSIQNIEDPIGVQIDLRLQSIQ